VNATPGSAIGCYPFMSLEAAIADHRLLWNRPVDHAASG
jgi:hypothetical protein